MKLSLAGVVAWARQTTTGAGFAVFMPALAGALTHTLTWPAASLPMAAGLIAMIWPEMPKATVAVIAPPVTNLARDLAMQAIAKRLDLVTDAKDALALLNAIEAAFATAAPATPPVVVAATPAASVVVAPPAA